MMKLRLYAETETADDLSDRIAAGIRKRFDAEAARHSVAPGRHNYDVTITGEPFGSPFGYDSINMADTEAALNRALLDSGAATDWRGDWGRRWSDLADLVLDVRPTAWRADQLKQAVIEDFRLAGEGAVDIDYVPLRGLVLQGEGLAAADWNGVRRTDDGRVIGLVLRNAWDDGLVEGIRAVYDGKRIGVPGFPPDEAVADGFYVEPEFLNRKV